MVSYINRENTYTFSVSPYKNAVKIIMSDRNFVLDSTLC